MDELKVSVVVPVYNLEDYIEKCIQSILDQTYKNYELILVDDGSTDHSYDMCQKYSESYDNIFAYSQENGGPNAARLTGVENSTGEYILFVDGDDWIESNMLEELVKKQQESGAEIVTSGAYRGVGEQCTKKVDSLNEGIYEKEDLKEIYSRLLINHKFAEPGILLRRVSRSISQNVRTGQSLLREAQLTVSLEAEDREPVRILDGIRDV